jgi:hypothetical protein
MDSAVENNIVDDADDDETVVLVVAKPSDNLKTIPSNTYDKTFIFVSCCYRSEIQIRLNCCVFDIFRVLVAISFLIVVDNNIHYGGGGGDDDVKSQESMMTMLLLLLLSWS